MCPSNGVYIVPADLEAGNPSCVRQHDIVGTTSVTT